MPRAKTSKRASASTPTVSRSNKRPRIDEPIPSPPRESPEAPLKVEAPEIDTETDTETDMGLGVDYLEDEIDEDVKLLIGKGPYACFLEQLDEEEGEYIPYFPLAMMVKLEAKRLMLASIIEAPGVVAYLITTQMVRADEEEKPVRIGLCHGVEDANIIAMTEFSQENPRCLNAMGVKYFLKTLGEMMRRYGPSRERISRNKKIDRVCYDTKSSFWSIDINGCLSLAVLYVGQGYMVRVERVKFISPEE
ncbi:uncharacterized protein F4822DRAFT_140092 [Hypoxylon trugodes]|uniref:uncharacterized protein n=1 Tax=Hypoxylon trugodes TaxID=326681 RepID=UPI00219B9B29|nr:uncharacterized protein F4822DRAFT_140092 [Hypoxylon trugodes]KAI1392769.1 hypothetical protein F4822DRAFT_140092 [Hypoxylon trugodes]